MSFKSLIIGLKRRTVHRLFKFLYFFRKFSSLNRLLRYVEVAHGQFVTVDDYLPLQL